MRFESWDCVLKAIFNRLEDLGQLKEQESMQLYSEAAGKFLADRLVSGTCPKCGYEVRAKQSIWEAPAASLSKCSDRGWHHEGPLAEMGQQAYLHKQCTLQRVQKG